jgi:hypothetical protein
VERLGGVEAVAVTGSHLVGVSVLLGAPSGTVPVLSVHGVATGEGVQLRLLEVSVLTETRLSLYGSVVQGLRVFEPHGGRVVSATEGGLGENAGFGMGVAGSSDMVVLGVVVRAGQMLGLGPVSATSGLTGVISLGNEGVVESAQETMVCQVRNITVSINKVKLDLPSGGVVVLGCINDCFVEHTSGLLGDGVTQMSVGNNVGSVASVPGNSHGLTGNGSLNN